MTKEVLTADNYADMVALYEEIKARHGSESEMFTRHGYNLGAVDAMLSRYRAENDGHTPAPIPEETVTLLKSELVKVAQTMKVAVKEGDDAPTILNAVKSASGLPVAAVEKI